MAVATKYISFRSMANGGMHNITEQVQKAVEETGLQNGVAVVFCPGSTGAVSTVEYEPGLVKDVPAALDRIAPAGIEYAHHETWHDDNGRGHVKATILGPDLTIPLVGGRLSLGTWQQIVFIECDTKNRERKLVIQVMGE